MAYILTRSKKGFVAMVEKRRVPVAGGKTSVRNVAYVCGLGTMTQEEFETFRDKAHSITDQELRKTTVLACDRAVATRGDVTAKVAASKQRKTTVKRPARQPKKRDVPTGKTGKNYPVRPLAGYKGRDVGKSHTQIMGERSRDRREAEYMAKQPKRDIREKWAVKNWFQPGMGK